MGLGGRLSQEHAVSDWKALSLRQPWLWMVLHGKAVENRRRNLGLPRLPFLLHASSTMTGGDVYEALVFVGERGLGDWRHRALEEPLAEHWHRTLAERGRRHLGGFCGVARAIGILAPDALPVRPNVGLPLLRYELGVGDPPYRHNEAIVTERGTLHRPTIEHRFDLRWWDREQWGYLLADVKALSFVEGKGALGFFKVPPEVVEKLGLPRRPEDYAP